MVRRLVIIGAGMATGRLLERLLEAAPQTFEVTLFNAEPRGTYNRLMLSPVLAGEKAFADIMTHGPDWYSARGVTCRFGERVTAIDTDARLVSGEQGSVPYDDLVIATGSTPFIVPLPGAGLEGVMAYRDVEDTQRMIDLGAVAGKRAVVIGGGVLGLEAAAGMAERGVDVTVIHNAGHPMNRQLDAEAGGLLAKALEARGITLCLGAASQEILGDSAGHVRALQLADGREIPCDLLVMAVGIRPATDLARAAGLEVNRGVVVDAQMRSSAPDVYALGECTEFEGTLFGLVAPLYDQAAVLAQVLQGQEAAFRITELATKLKVTGCDLFSAGDFSEGLGRENIVFRDPARGHYKRLVIEAGQLIGAVMYGDTADSAWLYDIILEGRDICEMRDVLMFGPAFEGAAPLDAYGGRCSLTA
ncbi:Nitrite reductase [NAD(P)H] [Aquimixticola soesokkakensis]|uniref:Nitrite reductase [NAD(P)H] n=1 Tax=Aquimixticola soesokkakensis TaxID=1519096 RepID=A0A1Y5STN7_9RHOB|nr:FAD-dependent oxidoreductase [Aquimixticola soesokkakensis]SLN44829.1 Nitrite reductase [NAD(P)H] [Aquimixticola soesokkakensis]